MEVVVRSFICLLLLMVLSSIVGNAVLASEKDDLSIANSKDPEPKEQAESKDSDPKEQAKSKDPEPKELSDLIKKELKDMKSLISKIDKSKVKDKILIPSTEISYLYDIIFNTDATTLENPLFNNLNDKLGKSFSSDKFELVRVINTEGYKINTKKSMTEQERDNHNNCIFSFETDFECTIDKEIAFVINENNEILLNTKLEVMESFLGIENEENIKVGKRIKNLHNAIGNSQYATDHIRFGVLTATTMWLKRGDNEDFVTEALMVHVYPSHRRFIPGHWDLYRRISFIMGLGTVIHNDEEIEIDGLSYLFGMGFDVTKGVVLSAGFQRQKAKNTGETVYNSNSQLFMGVSLNKDFWTAIVDQ